MAYEMTVQDMSNLSVAFAKSGLFGYKNSSEAFALMAIAQANGLHPAKAAERYHIIQGRPAMKADAMLSAFQEAGGKVRWIKRTDTECVLHLEHPQGGELDVKWTMERASKAGLTGKSTWKQFPAQMLSARCVSEGVRALFPACLSGMYTPEEVQDFDTKAPAQDSVPEFVEAETVEERAAQEQAVEAEIVEPEPQQQKAPARKPAPKKGTDDEQKAKFVAMMGDLEAQEAEAYANALKAMNIDSLDKVQPNMRQMVYKSAQMAVTEANKEADNG